VELLMRSPDHGRYWEQMWAPCFTRSFPDEFKASSRPRVGGGTQVTYEVSIPSGGNCVFTVTPRLKDIYLVVGMLATTCGDAWDVDLSNNAIAPKPEPEFSCTERVFHSPCTPDTDCGQDMLRSFREQSRRE